MSTMRTFANTCHVVAAIEERVRPTISTTWSLSRPGEPREEGRISRPDFDTLIELIRGLEGACALMATPCAGSA